MSNIFLGNPPENVKKWIEKYYTPLCFTAVDAGATIALKCNGNNLKQQVFQVSTDKVNWTDYTYTTSITLANAGDKIYFKAKTDNADIARNFSNYLQFTTTQAAKKVNVSGNIMSLLAPEFGQMRSIGEYCFYILFYRCKSIYDCSSLTLPATQLADSCYFYMFSDCTSMEAAPTLPATQLADSCYSSMFSDCTSMEAAPTLPATQLANHCYGGMFSNCTSLTAGPQIKTYAPDFYAFGSMLNAFDLSTQTWGKLTICNWPDLTLDEAEAMVLTESIFGYSDDSVTARISITCKNGNATVYYDPSNWSWVFERN